MMNVFTAKNIQTTMLDRSKQISSYRLRILELLTMIPYLHKDILYHIFQSAGEDEVRRYLGKTFTTIFEQLIEIEAEGIPASPEDKRLIARLLRNATTGFLVEWLESGMKLPIEQTVRRLDFLFTDLVREALKRSAADIAAE